MTKPRVLIADSMSSQALATFEDRGIEAVQPGKLSFGNKGHCRIA